MEIEKERLVRQEENQVSAVSQKLWETNISLWSLIVNALGEALGSQDRENVDREMLWFEEQSLDSQVREICI